MSISTSKYPLTAVILAGLFVTSCDGLLDPSPKGALDRETIASDTTTVGGLVTAAYAQLGNDHWFVPYSENWVAGSVASDDAYKGGLGTADQGGWTNIELRSTLRTDLERVNQLWERLMFSVSRTNAAVKALNEAPDFDNKTRRIAEMRFLRGHFYFKLKRIFKWVPYADASVPDDSLAQISNRELSNNELWNRIAQEFQFAIDNLPPSQSAVGRADKIDAQAYKAKVRLYQAYEKPEGQHVVANINTDHLQEVVSLTNQVISSGEHSLHDTFAGNYLFSYDNRPGGESLFAVQRSQDDGTPAGRLDRSTSLNYPMIVEYGCCSFNTPSQDLVNAFQTDPDGLPQYNSYNQNVVDDSADFQNNTFDPRLDHTVGHPGAPLKYQEQFMITDDNFPNYVRASSVYGAFTDAKAVQLANCPCLQRSAATGFRESSDNTEILTYTAVLLWKAEALIELGREDEALPIINDIRSRAANSTDRVSYADGTTYSNYNISEYNPGQNITWNQENARRALRWERRMEFAMEGKRFFDLVRWGIAAETMNDYYDSESQRRPYLEPANFQENQHEYLPIPEQQIDFSRGVYVQNPGY
jgi:hypothetical protein